MKQKFLTTAFCLLITISAFAYSGGNGTENNPYLISSKADMETLAEMLDYGYPFADKYFLLTQDLKYFNTITTVIGTEARPFNGIFDGGGHEIEMSLNTIGVVGVFGYVENATIKNLIVSGNISTTAIQYAGGICGHAANSSITNCQNTATVTATVSSTSSSPAGGICGYAINSSITNCQNTATISSIFSGGICGWYASGNLNNCYNIGNISSSVSNSSNVSTVSYSGGICGYSAGNLNNCYSNGNISSQSHNPVSGFGSGSTRIDAFSGGICGYLEGNLNNCYNTGEISSFSSARNNNNKSYSGGICGYSIGNLNNSYNIGNLSALSETNINFCYIGSICAYGSNIRIENCFAANTEITTSNSTNAGRILGTGTNIAIANCYALSSMTINNIAVFEENTANEKNGRDMDISSFQSQIWIMQNLGWNFTTIWKQRPIQFPVLYYYKYPPVITFSIPTVTYGDQITLNASSDNTSVPIAYETSDNTIAEISDNILIARKTGSVVITARQEANNDYSTGVANVNLTIQKKTITITANAANMVYGDTPPAYTCRYSGFVNGENASIFLRQPTLICNVTAQSNAGNYDIVPVSAEAQNYSFNYVNGILTIQKRPLQVTPDNVSRQYGYANPTFTLSYSGFVNSDTEANITVKPATSTTATANSNVDGYPISCYGGSAANYSFSYEDGTLTVTKALLTASAGNVSRNYGASNPAFSITYLGFKNSDTKASLTVQPQAYCTATSASNADTYPVIVSGGDAVNYDFSYTNGSLTVNKVPVTVIAQPATSVYGDTPPAYNCQYIGFVNSETESVLTQPPSLSCNATALSDAGQYSITPSNAEAQNYTFSYQPGTLTIQKRSLQVTPDNVSRAYGDANPAFTLSYSGFVNGNNASSIGTKPAATAPATQYSNTGEYTISCSGGSSTNYSFTYGTGKLTVTKAPLTATAVNASRNYGANNPAFSVSYSGFRNSDTKASLTVEPQASCTATSASGVDTYPVNISGGEAANYEFSYIPGTLTVNKAPLTVAAQPASSVYGNALPAYSCTYSGFMNNESEEVLTRQTTFTCSATPKSNTGDYTITPSGAEAENYTFSYVNGTLSITPALLTVSIGIETRLYGAPNPDFTLHYSGFKNNETEDVLTEKPSVNFWDIDSTSGPGGYEVGIDGGSAANYTFEYIRGILMIERAPLTVTAQSVSSVYGDALPAYSCTYSGFVNDETEEVLTRQPNFSCSATPQSNVGTYTITASGVRAENYTFQYVKGELSITPALLTVSTDTETRLYGDPNPDFTLHYSGFKNDETEDVLTEKPFIDFSSINSTSSAGGYEIGIDGGSATNYTFEYIRGILMIERAPLTITANDAVRNKGEDNPAFTLSYSGFKNSESESVLDALPSISCGADKDSPAGFYDIILAGGYDNNYDYQLAYGRLEVMLPSGMEGVSVSKVSVYPNPVKHDLYIQSDCPVEKVEIYNQSGLCVLADGVFTGKIDVSSLSAGVYYVRIYTNGVPGNRKIIVEK